MQKKCIVRLNEQERRTLEAIVKKFSGSSQKVRRAQIVLAADGLAWTNAKIADAYRFQRETTGRSLAGEN